MKVVVADLDRQSEKGEALAKAIGGAFVPCDVTSTEQANAAIAAAVEMAPLRALVNAAGIGWASRTISRDGSPHDLDVYRKVIEINLIGTFNCLRLAASAMNSNEPDVDGARGAVVNIASVAAFDGQIGQAAYGASKAGVAGMTLPMARDLARNGIRVMAIAPGIFETPMVGQIQPDIAEALGKMVPFPPRLGRPSEFAALVRQIVENVMLNGEVIRLDGAIRMAPK